MLDGVLTANIQPEGLQEGDIVVLAYTDEHSDPVLKGHVEATFAPWGSAQIGLAHARLAWPSTLDVRIQKMGDLPATQPTTRDRTKVYELTMRDVEPVIAPKGAPLRFHIARIGEATDFRSWAEPAKLLMPLFRDAAVISASGSLHDEVDKIRKASADPKNRTEQALQLVQERVRYVALLMGQGGYVPAPAETTWSRRYGDCKAKTALLLAILHDLGITAEAVVANVVAGDVIADRLPSIGMFNHVLVRAHIGGKTYWLDGTRTGDTSLDDIKVPDFGWGLPLVDNAQLIHIVPAPLREPSAEHNVSIDASAGIFAPSTITIEEVDRSDSAVQLSTVYSASSAEQRDEQFRNTARGYFDDFTVGSSSYQFDKAKREFVVTIKGTAKLDWKDSWFNVPTSSIAFDPDFDRLAGPFHDAPWAISHPRYVKDHVTVRLPAGFAAEQKLEPNVHETLAGVEYARSETVNGDVITVDSSERSIVAEVPYKDTLAAAPRLKALSKDGVYLQVASVYHSTPGDLTVLAASRPVSAYDYVQRGSAYQSAKKYDEAITDFTASLSLDSKNVPVLLMRAYAHLDNGDFVEAEKDVSSAEVIAPADAGVAQARIIIATRRADWPNVVAATTKALALDPKNKLALQKRSWAYVQKKDYAAAEKDLAALESIDPTNDAVTATRAAIADRKGDLQSALAGYSKALERNPGDTFARYQRGMLLYRDWKYDDAIRDYSEILRNDPKNAEVLGSRALAYVYNGDYAAAEADTAFGLKLSPKNSGLLFAKAKLDERRGSSDAEIESYSKLIESQPG